MKNGSLMHAKETGETWQDLGSIGSFQGVLNPPTGLSVFEVFVIPILLYECETWILTPALLSKLEKLQSEIGKRILKHVTEYFCMAKEHGVQWQLDGN